jgi:hypothetical protein
MLALAARAWVDACLPVDHHDPSLASTRAPRPPAATPSPSPRSRPVLPRSPISDPASASPYEEWLSRI